MSDLARDFEGLGKDWRLPPTVPDEIDLSQEEPQPQTMHPVSNQPNPYKDILTPELSYPVDDKGEPRNPKQVVRLLYTNYEYITRWRLVIPLGKVEFGSTPYHTEPQWLMRVYDLEKKAERTYALKDIHEWRPAYD